MALIKQAHEKLTNAFEVYSRIAVSLNAIECLSNNRQTFGDAIEMNKNNIESLIKEHFPSGSGFDSGVKLNYNESNPDKLVFDSAFHNMDENGFYDGWDHFKIIITPSLRYGFNLRLKSVGKWNRKYAFNRDYIMEVFNELIFPNR